MPAVIPIAVAAIAAAGTAAGSAISARGAGAAAAAGRPSQHAIPLTPYLNAFERHQTRLLAENATQQPPSFADWVMSGGKETFPLIDLGFEPREAKSLGIVGPRGQQIPRVSPSQTSLTPEQQLYLGYQNHLLGQTGPNVTAYLLNQRIGKLEGKQQTSSRQEQELDLRTRRNMLLSGGFQGGLN